MHAELKTKPTQSSVADFIAKVKDPDRRRDCKTLVTLMKKATGASPRMWGPSIVGFGDHHYKYASGREGDWFQVGFSPRAQALTLYLMCGLPALGSRLNRLGKHRVGKGCLYIKRLSDVDVSVLEELIRKSVTHLASKRS